MPGSAARKRVVEGAGRPIDVGTSHAGIPLGDPCQPPVPHHVYDALVAAGGGAAATAELYEHWLPPVVPPACPTYFPPSIATENTARPAGGAPPDATVAAALMKRTGYAIVRGAIDCAAAQVPPEPFSMRGAAADGWLTVPSVLALAEEALGGCFRISDVQPQATALLAPSASPSISSPCSPPPPLQRAWPHAPSAEPCASAPPFARLHSEATLVLHTYLVHTPCVLHVQPLDAPRGTPVTMELHAGDAAVLDSRAAFTWVARAAPSPGSKRPMAVAEEGGSLHGGSVMDAPSPMTSGSGDGPSPSSQQRRRGQQPGEEPPFALRVSFAPWWFDASVLADGSIQRRRVLAAFEAGRGLAPPPARPPLTLCDLPSRTCWDLLQHWEVEQGGTALTRVLTSLRLGTHDEASPEALEACPLDLLATYGRIWALQQMLQCGLFDVAARALDASGPAGMGSRSFMAAKVRVDERATSLIPLLVASAVWPSVGGGWLLLLAHAANVWLHATRIPFVWDHELWDMITELVVMAAICAELIRGRGKRTANGAANGAAYGAASGAASGSGGVDAPPTNRAIARCAPTVRSAMIVFYSAAAFWKFNTSFFDPIATCAPVFLMQLVAAYLPGELVPPGALTDVLTWTAPHVAATVEVLIPLLLSQASRPLLRQLGLALGLTFHFLIALTPPPNNAGGFSVGATVRYFFFMPAATSAACHLLTPSLYLPTMATTTTTLRSWLGSGSSAIALRGLAASLYDLKSLALIGAVVAAVITAASQGSVTLQGSLPVFMVVGIVYVRAFVLTIGSRWSRATKTPASFPRAPSKSHSRGHLGIANALFLALAFAYAYALPILGLQDIAACGMFANMHFVTAAYTGSNHWLVPTGLLQARYEHASARDNPFAGGVVQIVHTTSSSMRDLFPAESTSMLSPRAREYLSHAGHAAREFGPSTTRVVGTLPGMKPHPDPARPQLEYLLPAVELRRLLAEARANNESFTLTYKRVSRTGAPFAGRVVDVVDSPVSSTAGSGKEESTAALGTRHTRCTVRGMLPGFSSECADDELALLPPSDWWLTGLLLAFPMPMRQDGVHELGCLA